MTAIAWSIAPDRITVATDGLTQHPVSGHLSMTASQLFVAPHLAIVMAGTGFTDLAGALLADLLFGRGRAILPEVVAWAPERLRWIAANHPAVPPSWDGTSLAIFGLDNPFGSDPTTRRLAGFRFDPSAGFAATRIADGVWTDPCLPGADTGEGWLALIRAQRQHRLDLPAGSNRKPIAGMVTVCDMTLEPGSAWPTITVHQAGALDTVTGKCRAFL